VCVQCKPNKAARHNQPELSETRNKHSEDINPENGAPVVN
jgi:hypothetical protein